MLSRLQSLEELMQFAMAGELVAQRRRPLVSEMDEKDITFLPVSKAGKLVGVASERDIARGVILQYRAAVREIMTTRVQTVAPETTVPECLMLMHRERIRHLPVTSGAIVLGVLSVRDLMGAHRAARATAAPAARRAVTLLFPSPSSY